MGLATPAPTSTTTCTTFNDDQKLPAALLAFPSPASVTDSLETPSLSLALDNNRSLFSPRSPPCDLQTTAILPSTEPEHVPLQAVMTPPLEQVDDDRMNLLVGGALAPQSVKLPDRPAPKTDPGLRLPSFDALGIAVPHPDRYGMMELDATLLTPLAIVQARTHDSPHPVTTLQNAFQRLSVAVHSPPSEHVGRAIRSPIQQIAGALTPPAERDIEWTPTITGTQDANSPSEAEINRRASTLPSAHASRPALTVSGPTPEAISVINTSQRPASWIDGACTALIRNVHSAPHQDASLRILSHALPVPSMSGHKFPVIIDAVHESTPASPATPTTWINVFHAVQGRFNLADLPTSPPTTPGPPIGGDDYFTQKIFDSAVSISDYQSDASSLPRSPRAVVPPLSINVSIVERYIPPSSANEFTNMFDPNGPSLLIDRLVELSPNNGCLVFIYPTKTGAKTFKDEWLDPILDPILHSMTIVHGLSFDLSRRLSHMAAVSRMLEFDLMHLKIQQLLSDLRNNRSGSNRFHGRSPQFSISYAAKKEVEVERQVWAQDWWSKQEKPRIRDLLTQSAAEAQRRRSNEHVERPVTATELLHTLLSGVNKNAYKPDKEPGRGIEVSVFVIKRER